MAENLEHLYGTPEPNVPVIAGRLNSQLGLLLELGGSLYYDVVYRDITRRFRELTFIQTLIRRSEVAKTRPRRSKRLMTHFQCCFLNLSC